MAKNVSSQESLDDAFERLTSLTVEEMEEIEVEQEPRYSIQIGQLHVLDWLKLKNVRLTLPAVMVISMMAAGLVYFVTLAS